MLESMRSAKLEGTDLGEVRYLKSMVLAVGAAIAHAAEVFRQCSDKIIAERPNAAAAFIRALAIASETVLRNREHVIILEERLMRSASETCAVNDGASERRILS
jgi:hypothetical protein